MRSCKDSTHYEYIAVYVDDLVICMKDPQAFCDTLKEVYKAQAKGCWATKLPSWLWIHQR